MGGDVKGPRPIGFGRGPILVVHALIVFAPAYGSGPVWQF